VLLICILFSLLFSGAKDAFSQSNSDEWQLPTNVSTSGSATNPVFVVDSRGSEHVFWLDTFSGYMYSRLEEGGWSIPKEVGLPSAPPQFPVTDNPFYPEPLFMADLNGRVHEFWIDENNIPWQSSAAATAIGATSAWWGRQGVSDNAIDLDVAKDEMGDLHVAYVRSSDSQLYPAGVYYRRLITRNHGWSAQQLISPSPYFRSMVGEDANVRIATATVDGQLEIYVTWDNRPRNRILFSKSTDDGRTWSEPVLIDGSEINNAPVVPFNARIEANEDSIVIVWQRDEPGESCNQVYRYSNDAGETWQTSQRMFSDEQACAEENEILRDTDGTIFLVTSTLSQIYLSAWNGSQWSLPQVEDDAVAFADQETLALVSLGCLSTEIDSGILFMAGCDTGVGGDVWVRQRSLVDVPGWFSEQTEWTRPVSIGSSPTSFSSPKIAAGINGSAHLVWTQQIGSGQTQSEPLFYARWTNSGWSSPVQVFGLPLDRVRAPALVTLGETIYVAFVDEKTGYPMLTSVDGRQALDPERWTAPVSLPVLRPGVDSTDISITSDGELIVAYSIPINEQRGVYVIRSSDKGASWTDPELVFDAASAGWSMVDTPQLAVAASGDVSVLFRRYSLAGNNQPLGLYFSRLDPSSGTWVDPAPVSNQLVVWSDIEAGADGTLHRIWEVNDAGNYVIWHQVSRDGGATWSGLGSLRSQRNLAYLSPIFLDGDGNVHLFEMSKESETRLQINHIAWEDPQWRVIEVQRININTPFDPEGISGAITTDQKLIEVYQLPVPVETASNMRENTLFAANRSFDADGSSSSNGQLGQTTDSVINVVTPAPTETLEAIQAPSPSTENNSQEEIAAIVNDESPDSGNKWLGLFAGVGIGALVTIVIFIVVSQILKRRGLQ
jgi:hypothetical protein